MKVWVLFLLLLHGIAGAAERPQDFAFCLSRQVTKPAADAKTSDEAK
jgi:hypothetical protein